MLLRPQRAGLVIRTVGLESVVLVAKILEPPLCLYGMLDDPEVQAVTG
jgi:hypothetical protein